MGMKSNLLPYLELADIGTVSVVLEDEKITTYDESHIYTIT